MSWNRFTFIIFSMPFLTEFTGEGVMPVSQISATA
jgi:hypothetical protein